MVRRPEELGYGDLMALLEPDVASGLASSRGLNRVVWVAKALRLWSPKDAARGFLTNILKSPAASAAGLGNRFLLPFVLL